MQTHICHPITQEVRMIGSVKLFAAQRSLLRKFVAIIVW
jgi:hypothetical protein